MSLRRWVLGAVLACAASACVPTVGGAGPAYSDVGVVSQYYHVTGRAHGGTFEDYLVPVSLTSSSYEDSSHTMPVSGYTEEPWVWRDDSGFIGAGSQAGLLSVRAYTTGRGSDMLPIGSYGLAESTFVFQPQTTVLEIVVTALPDDTWAWMSNPRIEGWGFALTDLSTGVQVDQHGFLNAETMFCWQWWMGDVWPYTHNQYADRYTVDPDHSYELLLWAGVLDSGDDVSGYDVTLVGQVSCIPVPGALLLGGLGAGLVGWIRRRKR